MRVAMIQMQVGEDKVGNLYHAMDLISKAKAGGADLAVLPEMFCCPYETPRFPIYAEPEGGPHFQMMAKAAADNGIYLVAGSMPESDEAGHTYNTAYAFGPDGSLLGKHRKMHLFDIDVKGGQSFRESDTLTAGNQVTTFDTEFGRMGLAVCYDIRFPELFRLMANHGARVIIVPGAFNMTTGPAHWELSFRARALDNQVFTVGVSPARDVNGSYVSYANSIACSPWGDVLSRMDEKEGIGYADLNLARVDEVRAQLPLTSQRRLDLYSLTECHR